MTVIRLSGIPQPAKAKRRPLTAWAVTLSLILGAALFLSAVAILVEIAAKADG